MILRPFGVIRMFARLQVAVYDAAPMRIAEAGRELDGVADQLGEGQRAGGDPLGERLAFDELHHQVVHAAVVADVVDRGDARVVQLRGEPCFAVEALPHVRIVAHGGADDLDRDDPLEPTVACSIDLAHAAGGDEAENFVRSHPHAGVERHSALLLERPLSDPGSRISRCR